MDLLLAGAAAPLEKWEARGFSPGAIEGPEAGDRRDDFSRRVAREEPGKPRPDGAFARAAQAILAFRVFPPRLVTGVLRTATVEVGGIVGLRYRVLPGVELFFASRAIERFDEQRDGVWRVGFSYRTLLGHPECGQETFSAEKNLETGEITVALRSWSRPGFWLTRLGAPVTRLVQVHANRAALRNLERVARG